MTESRTVANRNAQSLLHFDELKTLAENPQPYGRHL